MLIRGRGADTRVLNKHAWVQSCTAFSSIYNDSGLVGIYATAVSGEGWDEGWDGRLECRMVRVWWLVQNSDSKESVVDLMCHELLAVASPSGGEGGSLLACHLVAVGETCTGGGQ